MVWGINGSPMLQRKGAMIMEKGEREGGAHRGLCRENISPQPLTEKTRRADYRQVLQAVKSKTEILEVHVIALS